VTLSEVSLFGLLSTKQATATDVAALVDAHATTLFRVAYSILRSHAEAEDTVQDTLVRVLEHRHQLASLREPRPWLIRICWNLALDRKRKHQPHQADDAFLHQLANTTADPASQLADAQQLRLTLAAIDRLPAPERQALLLAALDELSTTEIAAVMGKSDSAVRALIHRARQQLRQRLPGARP